MDVNEFFEKNIPSEETTIKAAKILFTMFKALKEQGFTDQQALELLKSQHK